MKLIFTSLIALLVCVASEFSDSSSWEGMLYTGVENSTVPVQLGAGVGWPSLPNRTCDNDFRTMTCAEGYFCVLSRVCMPGIPSDWSPASLIATAVTARIAQVRGKVDCIKSAGGAAVDLMASFNAWNKKSYRKAFASLRKAIANQTKALGFCMHMTWWQLFKKTVAHVMKNFKADMIIAKKIIVHGVDLFNLYQDMATACSDGVKNFIQCGARFGDLILEVHRAASDIPKPNATILAIA